MEAEAHFTGHLTIFYTFHIGLCYSLKTTPLMSHCATTLKYNILLCILYDVIARLWPIDFVLSRIKMDAADVKDSH